MAFPNFADKPDIVQDFFGEGCVTSAYFLKTNKIGVLSVPTFGNNGNAASETFSQFINKLISQANVMNPDNSPDYIASGV